MSTNLVHKPYAFLSVTNFSNSSTLILSSVYTLLVALQFMVTVELMQSRTIHLLSMWSYLNLLQPGCCCNIATLSQYMDCEDFTPRFFDLGQVVNQLSQYPKRKTIYTTSWLATFPTHREPSSALDEMLVAFSTLLALHRL